MQLLSDRQSDVIDLLAETLVSNPQKADLDLFSLVEMSPDKIFAATAAKVEELSGGQVRIVRVKPADGGFPFLIQGPAAYCKRIDDNGEERKFTIFAGSDGLDLI